MRPGSHRFLPAALCGVLALLVVLGGFVVRTHDGVDLRIVRSVHRWALRNPGEVSFWHVVATAGQPVGWEVLGAAVAVVAWRAGRRSAAALIVVSLGGGELLFNVVKLIVARPRPVFAHPVARAGGYAFPSGHALISFVAMALAVRWGWGWLTRVGRGVAMVAAAVVILAIGWCRLVLGVHYPSDVAAGWLLGAFWTVALLTLWPSDWRARGPSTGDSRRIRSAA